jgi:hypothetical protein
LIWTLMILVMQIISRRLLEADLMLLQWSNQETSLVKTPTPRARSKLKKFSPWRTRSPRTRSSKSFEIMDFRHRSKLCKKKPECLEHHHTFEQRWVITGESGTNGNRWKYSILYSASWRCEKDHDASAGTTSCLHTTLAELVLSQFSIPRRLCLPWGLSSMWKIYAISPQEVRFWVSLQQPHSFFVLKGLFTVT